jgi:hypothetical protein
LRRRIAITVSEREARAVVCDDFHHFRVSVSHDHGLVTNFASQSVRVPYSLCPLAGERLEALIGLPLTRSVTDIHGRINGRDQCTHQFDLAAMAIAAAARRQDRSYSILVTDPIEETSFFRISRDDGHTLQWTAARGEILAPEPFAGRNLRHGFTDWAARSLDEDSCEAALALRRTHMISNGRQIMDELNARENARGRGGCWVQQPERATHAIRIPTYKPDGLFDPPLDRDDEAWLGFN